VYLLILRLAQHQIIQHQKKPGWCRFGAGHTYLVRDETCGTPLSAISMAIVIIPNLAGMFNENKTFFKQIHHEAHEEHEEIFNRGLDSYLLNPFDYAKGKLRSVSRKRKCKNQNVKCKNVEALRVDFYIAG
jgi:hypothetical protein